MEEHGYQNYPGETSQPAVVTKSLKSHKSFDEVVLEETEVFEPGHVKKSIGHNSNFVDSNNSILPSDIDNETKTKDGDEIYKPINYSIEYIPSWLNTLGLAFQVYLMMAGTTVSIPVVLTPAMCMKDNDPDRANVVSTFVFVSGIVTILQSSFGTRLPIVQGGSSAFLIPALTILSLQQWKCPPEDVISGYTKAQKTELWQSRMREIQGAILMASLFQVVFGFLGIIGIILRFITPMTVAPSVAMIGLSLFEISGNPAGQHWTISLGTIGFIILFSQYMSKIKFPVPFTKSSKRPGTKQYRPFQNLPLLFGMLVMWVICAIFTATGLFDKNSKGRTDTNNFQEAEFFRVPYPFQWGIPTVSIGAVFGMLAGVIAGIVESVGDYYACARIVGAKAPPTHAVNRGIFIEGIGCIIAGIWGTGNGTTSYSENIGAIGVTQMGSRRVIQIGGLFMIFFSLFGQINAIFVSIPSPIIGAFLIVVFSMVTAVGLSNLRGVDLNSPRNIFIIGFSIFFSLTLSQWMKRNENVISTGYTGLNQMLSVFLSTGMFLGGFIGFILDNTIPGTREERGLVEWDKLFNPPRVEENETGQTRDDSYDLPFIMPYLRQSELAKWVPISPTFQSEKYRSLFMKTLRFEVVRQKIDSLTTRRQPL